MATVRERIKELEAQGLTVSTSKKLGKLYKEFEKGGGDRTVYGSAGFEAPKASTGLTSKSPFSGEAPTIDVNQLYEQSFNTQEIQDLRKQIEDRKAALAEQEALINDNPFYSEATRVGKLNKLQEKAGKDIALIEQQLATRTGDASTKLNLALKQYDINRQSYQDNLAKLDVLLKTGGLAGASESDVANIAASTGFSTDMVKSIIQKSQESDVSTNVITSTDDFGNVTVAVVNSQTGEIIAQNGLGAIGTKTKSSGGTGGLTTSQVNTAVNTGISILSEEDISTQMSNADPRDLRKGEIQADKLLSAAEQDRAFQRILALVGYDIDLASQIFTRAWDQGGFSTWEG